jgi:hypothetical protein
VDRLGAGRRGLPAPIYSPTGWASTHRGARSCGVTEPPPGDDFPLRDAAERPDGTKKPRHSARQCRGPLWSDGVRRLRPIHKDGTSKPPKHLLAHRSEDPTRHRPTLVADGDLGGMMRPARTGFPPYRFPPDHFIGSCFHRAHFRTPPTPRSSQRLIVHTRPSDTWRRCRAILEQSLYPIAIKTVTLTRSSREAAAVCRCSDGNALELGHEEPRASTISLAWLRRSRRGAGGAPVEWQRRPLH